MRTTMIFGFACLICNSVAAADLPTVFFAEDPLILSEPGVTTYPVVSMSDIGIDAGDCVVYNTFDDEYTAPTYTDHMADGTPVVAAKVLVIDDDVEFWFTLKGVQNLARKVCFPDPNMWLV